MRCRIGLLVIAPFLALHSALAAQVLCPRHEERTFASGTADQRLSQLQQSVAALPGGGFAFTWIEGRTPECRVRLQLLDRHGRALSPEPLLVSAAGSDCTGASVVAHEDDEVPVAFASSDRDVLLQRFDRSGTPLWPEPGVVAAVRPAGVWEYLLDPYLVAGAAGDVYVGFHRAGSGWEIACQRLDGSGGRLWGDRGVTLHPTGDEIVSMPRGVSDGAGGALFFWRNQRAYFGGGDPGPMLMEGQRLDPLGRRLWGDAAKVVRETKLASGNGFTYRFFQVVSDGSGGAIVGFDDAFSPEAVVRAQRVSSGGELLWGDGTVISSGFDRRQHDQTIAAGDGGAFFALFESIDEAHGRVLLYRLGAAGEHLWSPSGTPLPAPGALDHSLTGSWDAGRLRATWTRQTAPYESDVWHAVFDGEGAALGSEALTAAAGAQYARDLAHSSSFGGLLALWDDLSKGWNDADLGGALAKDAGCRRGLFYTLPPCRLLDTRHQPSSPLWSSVPREMSVAGSCGVPPSATAAAFNVTVANPTRAGSLTAFATGSTPAPMTGVVDFRVGTTRAGAVVLGLSFGGTVSILPVLQGGGAIDVIVDVSGYFE